MITIQPREPGPRCAPSAPGGMTCVTPRSGNRHTADHHQHETSAPESTRQNHYTNPLHTASADRSRIFATDAIMNGMPPHICQLLMGHASITTTMGYKAVYPEEAVNGHRAFIARRRELRPSEEYRSPTDSEWEEFLGHFERRRLALGDCGRAWGSSCIHEHSCIRCSLLRVDPAQKQRLEDIRGNLTARIAEAEREGWAGEAEGLKVSLSAANNKLAQIELSLARRAETVSLGLPSYRDTAAATLAAGDRHDR
jgi:hypothetical protein